MHEFDRSVWFREEPDYVRIGDPTCTRNGEAIANLITSCLSGKDAPYLPDGKYLGLAAGRAYPELAMASQLGIDTSNITLVDRQFRMSARDRFQQEYPQISTINSGMFAFLENPPARDYALISALGVEYALEDPAAVNTFIAGISEIITPDGIVVISPYTGEDPSDFWQEAGFSPLSQFCDYRGWASTLIYTPDHRRSLERLY